MVDVKSYVIEIIVNLYFMSRWNYSNINSDFECTYCYFFICENNCEPSLKTYWTPLISLDDNLYIQLHFECKFIRGSISETRARHLTHLHTYVLKCTRISIYSWYRIAPSAHRDTNKFKFVAITFSTPAQRSHHIRDAILRFPNLSIKRRSFIYTLTKRRRNAALII